jgi:hypothetical protein
VAITTGLNLNSGYRLLCKVCRHNRGSAPQKGERILRHTLITFRDELRNAVRITFREDRNGASRTQRFQIGMRFSRDTPSKLLALLKSLCARAQIHGA